MMPPDLIAPGTDVVDLGQTDLHDGVSGPLDKLDANYEMSIDFLEWMHPNRRWLISTISSDPPSSRNSSITTTGFNTSSREAAREWISFQNRLRSNIYFSVNEVAPEATERAGKKDILTVPYLHLDLDPRPGEPLEVEQRRIYEQLTGALPLNVPPPTAILFSGGGYQAFWQLSEPIPVWRDSLMAESAERYNLHLLEAFDGPRGTHDISRIMRLPGTINWPDLRKKKNGRMPAVAKVKLLKTAHVYGIDAFQVPDIGSAAVPEGRAIDVHVMVSGVQRVNLTNLPFAVSERLKKVIRDGRDAADPQRHPSRSEGVVGVLCGLVRAGCSDQVIYNVVTDPGYGISESVLEKGKRSQKYAIDQIKKARTAVATRSASTTHPHTPTAGSGRSCALDLARLFVDKRDERLIHYDGEYYTWQKGPYLKLEGDALRSEAYAFLESVGQTPDQRLVNGVLDAIRALIHLDRNKINAPCWIDGPSELDPADLLVCRNGMLHLPTMKLHPLDPSFLTFNTLDYDYDPQPRLRRAGFRI